MFTFKKIIIDKTREKACGAGLLELCGKEDKASLKAGLSAGFKGVKALPAYVLKEIIILATKYNNLLFDDAKERKNGENALVRTFLTALRIFEIIFNAEGNFWLIQTKKGEIAGFFYIYDIISLICPAKNTITGEIEYEKRPHTAVLAGCLKKDFWGIQSKKIFKNILGMLFLEGNFKKIKCEIFASNPYVKGILKKFNFHCEGILKNETINRGKPETVEIWALFKEQWTKNQKIGKEKGV